MSCVVISLGFQQCFNIRFGSEAEYKSNQFIICNCNLITAGYEFVEHGNVNETVQNYDEEVEMACRPAVPDSIDLYGDNMVCLNIRLFYW